MKKVTVSLLLGIAAGVLLTPLVLANNEDRTQLKDQWCFFEQYESMDNYYATEPPSDKVLIHFNGKKVRVSVPCPLPHSPTTP